MSGGGAHAQIRSNVRQLQNKQSDNSDERDRLASDVRPLRRLHAASRAAPACNPSGGGDL
eukprot:9472290-Pyramimonas_sp.AAC.1